MRVWDTELNVGTAVRCHNVSNTVDRSYIWDGVYVYLQHIMTNNSKRKERYFIY